MNTFIRPEQTWVLWAFITGWAALSIYLENKYSWAQKVTGAIIGLLGAIAFVNLRIWPSESVVYDAINDYVVPLAIPMLLFQANMKTIFRESGRLMIIFIISAVGTVCGALLAHTLLVKFIPNLSEIAAIMTGSYIGGGVNFVALSNSFKVPGVMVSAATVADNLNMALYFFILLAIPSIGFFRKNFSHPLIDQGEKGESFKQEEKKEDIKKLEVYDVAITFATATVIVAVSNTLAGFFGSIIPVENGFLKIINLLLSNMYLIMTTITMLLATLFPKFISEIKFSSQIGNYLIYLFFIVIGVPASIPAIIETAPLLLVFCAIMVIVNMAFTFVGAKVFKFNLEEAIIASNAAIGGPSTASAMAIAKGWNSLIGPAIFVGLFGYIIGNYLGIIVGTIII